MRFEPIAVWIDDKRGVMAGAIVGAQAGLVVIVSAALERGGWKVSTLRGLGAVKQKLQVLALPAPVAAQRR